MGEVSRGLADGAGEGPEHRAGHQATGVLEQVTPVLGLSFSIRVAELANVVETHLQALEYRDRLYIKLLISWL